MGEGLIWLLPGPQVELKTCKVACFSMLITFNIQWMSEKKNSTHPTINSSFEWPHEGVCRCHGYRDIMSWMRWCQCMLSMAQPTRLISSPQPWLGEKENRCSTIFLTSSTQAFSLSLCITVADSVVSMAWAWGVEVRKCRGEWAKLDPWNHVPGNWPWWRLAVDWQPLMSDSKSA